MDSAAFFIRRDLLRAFVASKDDVRRAVTNPDAKRLKLVFQHPLGPLPCNFDKKSSEKLRAWLAADAPPQPAETSPEADAG